MVIQSHRLRRRLTCLTAAPFLLIISMGSACFPDLSNLNRETPGNHGGDGSGGTANDSGSPADGADAADPKADRSVDGDTPEVAADGSISGQDGPGPGTPTDANEDAQTGDGAVAAPDGGLDATDADARPTDASPADILVPGSDGSLDAKPFDARPDGPPPADPTPYITQIPVLNEEGGVEVGRADTNINAVSFRHNGLLTVGNYQLIAYYGLVGGSTYGVVVGRRKIGTPNWTLTKTAFTPAGADYSRTSAAIQFGIDGDGVMHMGWGGTGNAPSTMCYYTRSNGSVLNDAPISLIGGDIGNNGSITLTTPASAYPLATETSVQTTEFYAVPDTGDLLLTFRTGTTGNGHFHLARWDNVGKAWQAVHAAAGAPWIQGGDVTYGSPYVNQLVFDSARTLHATWTYRNAANNANYDVFYARSIDNGVTWTSVDEATSYLTPLTWTNPPHSIQIQPFSGFNLMNQCSMAVDTHDHPIVACWYTLSVTAYRQIMVMWHDGSAWRSSQVTARATTDSNPSDLARPIIAVDDDNRWIVVWRDLRATSNGIKLAYSSSEARDDWTALNLTTDNLGWWEPVYDSTRWKRDRVLSLYYQPCGSGFGAPTPVSVLEFRARDFFNQVPDGG